MEQYRTYPIAYSIIVSLPLSSNHTVYCNVLAQIELFLLSLLIHVTPAWTLCSSIASFMQVIHTESDFR